ncbi:hypothetical protein [Arthrobacter sp. zg-Y844]|uniref:hypothetical protein n=1 Tax=Arthrobacter sp. zg-Y844 TaxID=2964612 RepID=UPI002103DAD6|nr:hypothetical protein [Arthrobacter sp. zg-Y844]MCQ1986657.1 hypothetical protein [Arthrobacter sp. zg-Y844]
MGVHWEQLLDLSVDEAGAEKRLQEVRNWLRAYGWSKADPDMFFTYYDKHPADAFGPRSHLTAGPGFDTSYAFVAGRDFYHAGDGAGGPECRKCGTELPLMPIIPQIREWDEGGPEPFLICPECSWAGLLGNWDIGGCMAVSSFALVIDTSSSGTSVPLIDALIENLQTELGGRWAYVHHHL